MKKFFFALTMIGFSFAANAQMVLQGSGTGTLTFRKSPEFSEPSILGSKYFNENFSSAKVNKGTQDFLIRYNAFRDVLEYKNGNDIVELIKEQNTHTKFNNGDQLELLNYNIKDLEVSRYHFILFDSNNVKTSKFKSIKLNEAKKATSSYDTDQPASFKPNKDVYFITYKDQTIEFDGKSKDIEKLIPSKVAEIKKYFKDNKVKENDTDMIKLGKFLSTL